MKGRVVVIAMEVFTTAPLKAIKSSLQKAVFIAGHPCGVRQVQVNVIRDEATVAQPSTDTAKQAKARKPAKRKGKRRAT